MKISPVLVLAYLAGVVAIATPISLALNYTDRASLREQEGLAHQLAEQALRRNELITDQVYQAIRDMEAAGLRDPCSREARDLMARIALRSSHLQAVAYVRKDRIVCSSVDVADIDIGPAEYVTTNGSEVRSSRRLPFGGDSTYRITASASSGYAAVVHSELAFDILRTGDEVALGLVGMANMKPITRYGTWRPEWAQRLGSGRRASFFDGDYVVALRKSERYAYFAYAAIPARQLQAAWNSQAMLLVPMGIVAGLVLAFSVYLVTRQQLGLPAQLRSALRRDGELYLVYQPVVDMASRKWVGAEALLRWRRSSGESISPAIFIPLAERNNLIGQVTRKVISMVARDAADLLRTRPDFFISINFASTDLHDQELTEHLASVMHAHGLNPASLPIEATERTFIDAEQSRAAIQRLRSLGHRVAIDDFGTGYSSLSYLTKLEVDTLKIDRSFVETIGTGAVTANVVSHIIEMGKSLKLRMVAEGVETEAQALYLQERGVQLAQGWLFSQALGIGELSQRLAAQDAA